MTTKQYIIQGWIDLKADSERKIELYERAIRAAREGWHATKCENWLNIIPSLMNKIKEAEKDIDRANVILNEHNYMKEENTNA